VSPDQINAGMSQAQRQMGARKDYNYRGALSIKEEGNKCIKEAKYKEALELYDRALENLKPHAGDDVKQLRLQLLLNAGLCYLKTADYNKSIDTCNEALTIQPKSVKAVCRRGLAKEQQGKLVEALTDVKQANEISPDDKTVKADLERIQKVAKKP